MNIYYFFAAIASDLFLVSLFLYLAVMRLEQSIPGIVSRAFNPAILLAICIVSGILAIFLPRSQEKNDRQNAAWGWIVAVLLCFMTGSFIYTALVPATGWAPLFALAGGSIVFLASFAILNAHIDNGNDEPL